MPCRKFHGKGSFHISNAAMRILQYLDPGNKRLHVIFHSIIGSGPLKAE